MITTEQMFTLTTECTCEYYDDNDELVPSNDCYGCYDDDKAWVLDVLQAWLDRQETDRVKITCDRMRWNNLAGVLFVDAEPENLLRALTLNGDYRLEFRISSDDALSATRYSHDEPVGTAPFIFTPDHA